MLPRATESTVVVHMWYAGLVVGPHCTKLLFKAGPIETSRFFRFDQVLLYMHKFDAKIG